MFCKIIFAKFTHLNIDIWVTQVNFVTERLHVRSVERPEYLHQFTDVPRPVGRAAIRHEPGNRRKPNEEVRFIGYRLLQGLADIHRSVSLDLSTWKMDERKGLRKDFFPPKIRV